MTESLSLRRRHERGSIREAKKDEVKKSKRTSKHAKKSSKKEQQRRKHKRSGSPPAGPIPEFILIRSSDGNDGINSDFKPLWASGQSPEADLQFYRDDTSPDAKIHNRAPVATGKQNSCYAQSPPQSTEAPIALTNAVATATTTATTTATNQAAVSALLSLSDHLESPMPLASSSPQIKVPCRARGMAGSDHRFETAHFLISEDTAHGQDLICSHEKCQEGGIKFSFCKFCQIPVAKRGFKTRHGHQDIINQRSKTEATTDATAQTQNNLSTKVPCRARFMSSDHKFETAHFNIPANIQHGAELVCSHPGCRDGGVKFCFCTYCRLPVAKRNFRKRHLHLEDDNNAMVLPPPVANQLVCQPTVLAAALPQVPVLPTLNQEAVLPSPIASFMRQQLQMNSQSNVLLESSILPSILLPQDANGDVALRVDHRWRELMGEIVVEDNAKDENMTNVCDV